MAWTIALEQCFQRLYSAAVARAVNGTEVPVYQRGELIGSRRHFDERLTCYLLTRGSLRNIPLPRERREATDRWKGNFEELIERVRKGKENA